MELNNNDYILCSWVTLTTGTRIASYVYIASYTLYKLHKLRSHCHASGSLNLDNVKSIVLDWNWRDKKFKRMADIVDTRRDLMLLMQTYLIPHIHKNKCKIGILWLCVSFDLICIKELPIPRAMYSTCHSYNLKLILRNSLFPSPVRVYEYRITIVSRGSMFVGFVSYTSMNLSPHEHTTQ